MVIIPGVSFLDASTSGTHSRHQQTVYNFFLMHRSFLYQLQPLLSKWWKEYLHLASYCTMWPCQTRDLSRPARHQDHTSRRLQWLSWSMSSSSYSCNWSSSTCPQSVTSLHDSSSFSSFDYCIHLNLSSFSNSLKN